MLVINNANSNMIGHWKKEQLQLKWIFSDVAPFSLVELYRRFSSGYTSSNMFHVRK
jgi:hypothetical protein